MSKKLFVLLPLAFLLAGCDESVVEVIEPTSAGIVEGLDVGQETTPTPTIVPSPTLTPAPTTTHLPRPTSTPKPVQQSAPTVAKIAPPATGGSVKLSVNGICHAPGTTYYDRTTNFTAYSDIDSCLAAGGRLPLR